MVLQLKNDQLSATINAKGAELTSLRHNHTGIEYIWQADPAHWGRHTPVLFPIVGKLKDDVYFHDGKPYKMGQHGFARDAVFDVVEQSDTDIKMLLKANEASLAKYPFQFRLYVSHHLANDGLRMTYEVINPTNDVLPFSIGGHPAFNCPLQPGYKRSDYALHFDKNENTLIHYLTNGYFAGEVETFEGNVIEISDNLFDRDALVFEHLNSEKISLVDAVGAYLLTFHFKGFPYLGIWSKNQTSPFVCIEPWFGLADSQTHDQVLMHKKGIVLLKSNESFTCQYRIELH